jgi:hypothetical protein
MPSVVLIHGTGTRESGYKQMLAAVKSRLHLARESYTLQECPWYADFGTPNPPYQSSPEGLDVRAVGSELPFTDEVLSWQHLYIDPLAELRELSQSTVASGGSPAAGAQLTLQIQRCPRPDSMRNQQELPVLASWDAAKKTILEDQVTITAVARGASRPEATRSTVARALVAELIRRGIGKGDLLPDGEQRDIWVNDLSKGMGADLAVTFRAVPKILTPFVRLLNRRLIRPFGESHSPIAADILFYQSRGQGIRDFIARCIASAPQPAYVLAHSLGGIAVVDALVMDPSLKVEALITFGSQAPFLQEMNALVSLEKRQPLPAHFPNLWCNVYDPNDLLSFRATKVFTADPRVKDEKLDSGQPPLVAHSAYLTSNAFWQIVWNIIPYVAPQ